MADRDTLGDFGQLPVVPSGTSLEGEILTEEELRLLREAIEQLSPQRRAAFQLRVFHGCSYKEIASRLGIAPKTVENHVGCALRETHVYLGKRYQLTTIDQGRRSSTAEL